MTTLVPGASQTISVGDGGSVSLSSNGGFASVTVTPTVGLGYVDSFGPGPYRRVYGPFAEGGSVQIVNSTAAIDYDFSGLTTSQIAALAVAPPGAKLAGILIDGDSFAARNWFEQSPSAISQTGGLGSVTSGATLTPPIGSRVKIGNYTDPRWNGFFTVTSASGNTANFAIDPAADAAPSIGTRSQGTVAIDVQRGAEADFNWAEWTSGNNFLLVDNVAYGGRTLPQIAADAPGTIGKYTGCLIDFNGGTNDPKNGVATAISSAAMESYIRQAITYGHWVLINTVPYLAGAANTTSVIQLTAQLNKEYRRLALKYKMPLYDKAAALQDPASAAILAANVDSSDNIHLNPAGAKIAGTAKATIYANWVASQRIAMPATTQDLISINTSSANIFDGFFAGTAGTVGGSIVNGGGVGVATNWSVTGTLAATATKGSGSVGATQIATAPVDAAGSGKTLIFTAVSVHASVVAGGRYELVGKVSFANWTAGLRATLEIRNTINGYGNGSIRAITTRSATSPLAPGSYTITFRTEPFTVPVGATVTNFQPVLTLVTTGNTGGTETVTLENWAVNRLD